MANLRHFLPPSRCPVVDKSCAHNTLAWGMEMVSVPTGYGAVERTRFSGAPARSGTAPSSKSLSGGDVALTSRECA